MKKKAKKSPSLAKLLHEQGINIDLLIERIELLESNASIYEERLVRQEAKLAQAHDQLALYKLVFGPVWKTQAGFHCVPALMSDNHLANMAELGFGNESMQKAVRHEQLRRDEDDQWYGRKGKLSPRQQLAEFSKMQVLFKSLKQAHEDTQRRLGDVWTRISTFTEMERFLESIKHFLR